MPNVDVIVGLIESRMTGIEVDGYVVPLSGEAFKIESFSVLKVLDGEHVDRAAQSAFAIESTVWSVRERVGKNVKRADTGEEGRKIYERAHLLISYALALPSVADVHRHSFMLAPMHVDRAAQSAPMVESTVAYVHRQSFRRTAGERLGFACCLRVRRQRHGEDDQGQKAYGTYTLHHYYAPSIAARRPRCNGYEIGQRPLRSRDQRRKP